MSNASIRVARESDLPAISAIEDESFPSPYPRFLLERLLEEHRETFLVVTGENGTILGYCVASIEGISGHLISIAVDRGFRRRGHGTALMERVIREMDQKRVEIVRLEVKPDNKEAICLYANLGFEKKRILPKYYEDGSDAVEMRLALGRMGEDVSEGYEGS